MKTRSGDCPFRLDVRFVPMADVTSRSKLALLDHFIGAGKHLTRHDKPEGFRRPEIDYQFEFAR